MNEWKQCRKLPVVVHVREVRPGESGVETLEGYKPCNPVEHLVMRGINGEEYPIRKEIFSKTYEVLEE